MRRFVVATALSALCFANVGSISAESLLRFSEETYTNSTPGIQLVGCDGGGCDTGGCASGGCDTGGCGGAVCGSPCGSCCCGGYGGSYGGTVVFDVDIMFMKYHQAGGVHSMDAVNIVGNGEAAEYDFELSPRFSLGYELCNGLGYRLNYWYYDEDATTINNLNTVSIDTYTFDAEVYRRLDLGSCTSVEVSGGYRYVDFEQRDSTGLDWGFTNWGGTANTELSHHLSSNHRIFARSRLSVVMGDVGLSNAGPLADLNGTGLDHETTMLELALGWEARRCMCSGASLVYGFSGNWWQWTDAALRVDNGNVAQLTDASFGGFAFRVGLEY